MYIRRLMKFIQVSLFSDLMTKDKVAQDFLKNHIAHMKSNETVLQEAVTTQSLINVSVNARQPLCNM